MAPSATERSRAVIHVGFRHPLWGLENVLYSRYCFRDVTVKIGGKEEKRSETSWPGPSDEVPGLP